MDDQENKPSLKLRSLNIDLVTYGENCGKYEAKIEYSHPSGEVKLCLDPEVSTNLLNYIGPIITKFAHKAALEVESNIAIAVKEARQLPEIVTE